MSNNSPPLKDTVLLLIDLQQAFFTSSCRAYFGSTPSSTLSSLPTLIPHLLALFRSHNLPIIHVHHRSIKPDSPLHASQLSTTNSDGITHAGTADVWPFAAPVDGEVVVMKSTNSAFIRASSSLDLEAYVRSLNVRRLIVCGITTPHCVSSTVRMASDLNVVGRNASDENGVRGEIWVVREGCAAFGTMDGKVLGDVMHDISLAGLDQEFARVVSMEDVVRLFEERSLGTV